MATEAIRIPRRPEPPALSPAVWEFQEDEHSAAAKAPKTVQDALNRSDAAVTGDSSFSQFAVEAIRVRIVSSAVRVDDKGKPYTTYVVAILNGDDERWRIEKRFSNFLALDERLRKEYPDMVQRLPKLPEKTLFRRLSPAVVDARKAALEQYLQTLVSLMPKAHSLTAFLGSDIKANRGASAAGQMGQKQGYLAKRGRKLGVWKPRYYVFQGGMLHYYRNGRGEGEPAGSLAMDHARVERLPDNELEAVKCAGLVVKPGRHAFLLVDSDGVRHVYCAENDEERDDWVEILLVHIEMMQPVLMRVEQEGTANTGEEEYSPAPGLSEPTTPVTLKAEAVADESDDDVDPTCAGAGRSPSVGTVPPGSLVREGVLTARLGALGRFAAPKPHWCELWDSGVLIYHKSERKDGSPAGSIRLAYAALEPPQPEDVAARAAFTIDVPIMTAAGKALGAGVYRHVFFAASAEECGAWLSALSSVLQAT